MLTVLIIANYNTHRNNVIRHFQALHQVRAMKRRLVKHWGMKRTVLRAAAIVLAASHSRSRCTRRQPRMWMKPRIGLWFETEVMGWWEDDRWLSNFRMKKTSFFKLCNLLRGQMTPKANHVREPICLEARVAMCLYNLASCGEYRVTANQFGYHKTSVSTCILHICVHNMVNNRVGCCCCGLGHVAGCSVNKFQVITTALKY